MFRKKQVFIIPLILAGLLYGIWTGWARIGWQLPYDFAKAEHGALILGGFIGSLICLERTINFKRKIMLLIPFVSSLSVPLLMAGQRQAGYWVLLAGSLGLTIVYIKHYIKFSELHVLIMTAGALAWLTGNAILLKTYFYPQAVMWWIAFPFFTIIGERLELTRYLNLSAGVKILLAILLFIYAAGIIVPFHTFGGYITALSLAGSGIWLFRYDMARKTLKKKGAHFYSGIALITGYAWLIVCGLFMAYGAYSSLLYDAAVHSFFLGFVFSMIFAHAPIIVPGVLKLQADLFHRSLYVWLAGLQLSLMLRLAPVFGYGSDIKQAAGLLNGIFILGFFINMAVLVVLGKRKLRSG